MTIQEVFFLSKGDFIYYDGQRHEVKASSIKTTRTSKLLDHVIDRALVFKGEMLSGYIKTDTHTIPVKALLSAKLINTL